MNFDDSPESSGVHRGGKKKPARSAGKPVTRPRVEVETGKTAPEEDGVSFLRFIVNARLRISLRHRCTFFRLCTVHFSCNIDCGGCGITIDPSRIFPRRRPFIRSLSLPPSLFPTYILCFKLSIQSTLLND